MDSVNSLELQPHALEVRINVYSIEQNFYYLCNHLSQKKIHFISSDAISDELTLKGKEDIEHHEEL